MIAGGGGEHQYQDDRKPYYFNDVSNPKTRQTNFDNGNQNDDKNDNKKANQPPKPNTQQQQSDSNRYSINNNNSKDRKDIKDISKSNFFDYKKKFLRIKKRLLIVITGTIHQKTQLNSNFTALIQVQLITKEKPCKTTKQV